LSDYFYYERSQRKMAVKMWLNSLVVLVFFIFFYFNNPFPNDKWSYYAILLISSIVFLGLFLLAAWFWCKNNKFFIRVNSDVFECFDPLFKDFCFCISLLDIKDIRHTYSNQSKKWSFKVFTKDGNVHLISQNASYSREKLYQALEKAVPHIIIFDTASNSKRN